MRNFDRVNLRHFGVVFASNYRWAETGFSRQGSQGICSWTFESDGAWSLVFNHYEARNWGFR
jgi:hypothetical protein